MPPLMIRPRGNTCALSGPPHSCAPNHSNDGLFCIQTVTKNQSLTTNQIRWSIFCTYHTLKNVVYLRDLKKEVCVVFNLIFHILEIPLDKSNKIEVMPRSQSIIAVFVSLATFDR